MISTAARASPLAVLCDLIAPAAPVGLAARALAEGYLRAISAEWCGEPGWPVFERALDRCWSVQLPPVPEVLPDAVSPHGAGGRGIHWYETATEVLGYVPGVRCGYRLPIDAVPPA